MAWSLQQDGLPYQSGCLTVWAVYFATALWVGVRELRALPRVGPHRCHSTLVPLAALPVAILCGFGVGLASMNGVWWLCCGTFTISGNCHADEDLFFAHCVPLITILWAGLSAELHRRTNTWNWSFLPQMLLALVASCGAWAAIQWPHT